MNKLKMIGFAVLGIMMAAITAAAQPANQVAESGTSYKGYVALAAGIGFAIAVFGGAIGQSRIGAAACEGAARNPGAAGRIQTMMILGLALIESLVLFALLVIFAVVKPMAG
ncbi:MAG: F-type H+-transporting ATPase subunit c [Blastocatellia bacterium]|jgi:F-type H+-transporting ATPase subunit c|nr:F-type H+-transporting ATPase subunit c [Blastocatellia bacterium]